jgi:hypothetical protein
MKIADIDLYKGTGLKGFGKLGLEGQDAGGAGNIFVDTMTTMVGVLSVIGFIWFTIRVLLAAISWIGAGGDAQKVEDARKKLTNGIIGLVIVVSAVFFVDLVGRIFGVDFLDPTIILR